MLQVRDIILNEMTRDDYDHERNERLKPTLSASLYIDFGDGLGISRHSVKGISVLLDFRFSSDPNGAKLMEFVYK